MCFFVFVLFIFLNSAPQNLQAPELPKLGVFSAVFFIQIHPFVCLCKVCWGSMDYEVTEA